MLDVDELPNVLLLINRGKKTIVDHKQFVFPLRESVVVNVHLRFYEKVGSSISVLITIEQFYDKLRLIYRMIISQKQEIHQFS